MSRFGTLLTAFLALTPICVSAQALNREVVDLIRETAQAVCGDFAREGSENVTQIEGEAKAKLKGLAGRLANLGVEGAVEIGSSDYVGVLRAELGADLKDIRACRLQVLDMLQDHIDKPVLERAPPNHLKEIPGAVPTPDSATPPVEEILGEIGFSRNLNCTAYNNTSSTLEVVAVNYHVRGSFGDKTISVPCSFMCFLSASGGLLIFEGPENSSEIDSAFCSVAVR